MRPETADHPGDPDASLIGPMASRAIGRGDGWFVSEHICRAGPRDRPFEERHELVTIAAVVGGSFQYRADAGRALLYPGAFLLGNAGTCYECGHDHGTGDRCIAFSFESWLFEEIAAATAGSRRFRFPTAMLPAMPGLALPAVDVETKAGGGSGGAMEDLAVRLAETVLAVLSGGAGAARPAARPSPRDERRISNALRHIEAHAEEPLELADLAAVACMSKYHFLRTFRRIVGVTPYQFLLGLRMRRAAARLRTTSAPVAAIAYDAGFGDLSTFNGRFRAVFGASPGAFRRVRTGPARAP